MMLLFGKLFVLLTITAPITLQALPNGLTCETDYFLTMSCFLDAAFVPKVSQNMSYWLEFRVKNLPSKDNCSLSVGEDGYHCTFTAWKAWGKTFSSSDLYNINLCYLEGILIQCSTMVSRFKPSMHIKPLTPYNVTVQYVDGHYIVTWRNGYEKHRFRKHFSSNFQYTLSYHKIGNPHSAVSLTVRNQTISIPESHLDPDVEYFVKVCNIFQNTSSYSGTKSDWTTEVNWKTLHKKSSATEELHSNFEIAIPFCFAAAMLILLSIPVARNKIKEITWTATPAPFFYQLHQQHRGNLKAWLTKEHEQQIYSEEISKIDTITEITAVNEQKGHMSNPYPATQCPTPYVGPSAEIWLPFAMDDMRNAGNNSCKELEFPPLTSTIEESVLCLNLPTAVEGFLSLQDLETKEESSQGTETLTCIPKSACFTQNYCTLTNTANGLIPTFATAPPRQHDSEPDSQASASLNHPLNLPTDENTLEVITLTLDSLELSVSE